jgi:ferredoxin
VRAILPSNNFRFYVCGPGSMMESLVPALWAWGVPDSHVHFEAFGPATVKRISQGQATTKTARCQVHFNRTGRDVTWDSSFTSLLEIGEAAGVPLASGCRAGSCGECLVPIRAGRVTTLKRPGIAVPPGHCLACISVPDGDLVLEA